jgi:hypothetical protein
MRGHIEIGHRPEVRYGRSRRRIEVSEVVAMAIFGLVPKSPMISP